MKEADIYLSNDGTLAAYSADVKNLLESLGRDP
jgi:hypothetical protein